jgi:hypothetical protein
MFQQPAEARMRAWREFRTSLESLPLDRALINVAKFWSGAPFVPYNLDIMRPAEWPDPWALIDENVYCDLAKCLGIVYTVSLCKHKMDLEIELRTYLDPKNGHEYNLAWINQGKYIINMIDNEVLNIKEFNKTLQLKHRFTAVDLKLDYYNN